MHALIVSNGFPPTQKLLEKELSKADLLIGADGGGNRILEREFHPDFVIGDMDSFVAPENPQFEIIHDPDQETNDLEKALALALKNGAKTTHVLGAFGQRMDHSLKNLSVLKQFHAKFNRLIYRDENFDAFIVDHAYSGKSNIGSVVSLFPLSGAVHGIKTKGLKYPLSGETLENGFRDGTSNEAIDTEFFIEIEEGDLVVFVERI
jgi:thiamine pyrophosphokinase